MPRYKIIDGVKIQFTEKEEKAADTLEKAWTDGAADRDLAALRLQRNGKLAETDWTQNRDVTLSNDEDWKTYRQALRDITKDYKSLDDVKWPEKPE